MADNLMLNSSEPVVNLSFNMGVVYGGGDRLPNYEGSYTIKPKVEAIILPTKDRSMTKDLTITQIPYEMVENPSGGNTVIIGFE